MWSFNTINQMWESWLSHFNPKIEPLLKKERTVFDLLNLLFVFDNLINVTYCKWHILQFNS